MKGVRMQIKLRIGTSRGVAHDNGLNVIKWLGPRAADVSKEGFPRAATDDPFQFGNRAKKLGPDRHAPGDRVALLLLPAVELPIEQGLLKARKQVCWKKVANLDESVAIELFAPLLGHG